MPPRWPQRWSRVPAAFRRREPPRSFSVGPNSVEDASHLSALRLLLRQFESPLVLILIFAAAISLVLQQWVDSAIILAIVLGSTLLGFFQEYRASAAVEELKRRLALTCRVMRDGVERTVPVSTVVPGDLILLSAGNLIPADGLVIEAQDFLVSEASMTGESFPVEKQPGIVKPEAALSARTNAVFLGASVQSGTAKVLVVETGRRTAFGAIAARLRTRQPETDFARGVRQFGYLLIRAMVVIVLFVLTVNLLLGRPVIESLLFAVALAVGLSPELLPAIVSVTLSAGARAMGRRGVIVRRLEAIENLGSMDILCTDKTGTLTEGTIVLNDALDAGSRPSDEVRRLAFLNAAFETGIENPLDAAIVAAGKSAGLTTHGFAKIDEIPYDFLRRRLTIVVAEDGNPTQHLIVTKGAFSNVLDTCSSLERDAVDIPLTTELRAELDAVFKAKGAEGFRVLAVATRRVAAKPRYGRDDEQGMTFRGFLVFSDPPKADAQRTIHDLAQLGIRIKVISGDNRYVTAHLAEAVGLNSKSMLTGDDLGKLKDEALWHLAPRTDLFVEIDPQQKERIVRALQKTGHSVGYLGDGINDAPALHAADVGISVEEAVDVARESADIILLSRDLDVLAQRRGGREADLRQHAQVHLDHHQRELREHGEHGAGDAAASVPAAGGQADPAEQLSLRRAVDCDLERQRRSGPRLPASALEHQGHSALHDRLRADQLGLRSGDVRGAAPGLSRRPGHVSDVLVRRLAADRTRRRARPANAQARFSQQAQSLAAVVHACGRRRYPRDPVPRAPEFGVWFCASLGAPDGHRHRDRRRLHCGDGSGRRHGSSGPSMPQVFRSRSEIERPRRLSPDRILLGLS